MKKPRRSNAVTYALYANAALLLVIAIVLIGRDHSIGPSAAYGQIQQPAAAGGGGIYIMPAQLHQNVWGCFILDVDRQTLCVYEYQGGNTNLVLKSARDIKYDLQLKDYNTSPPWFDIQKRVEDAANQRVQPNPANSPSPAPDH